MNTHRARTYVNQIWDSVVVPTLVEYIKIPNKSPLFDADWYANGHMHEAAELLRAQIEKFDLANADVSMVELPGKTPLILIDVPATHGAQGNVLLYGHYDKQPEFDGWREGLGPWTPVLEDGRLYGRGGADDGYAIFGSLAAIAATERQYLPHPRCLVLIEGCEESGSADLPAYIEHLRESIGEPDLLICLDAECGNYDQMWLTTSLRGVISATLKVEVLTEGVHSGGAGGIVPSSFRVIRRLLDRIEDSSTGRAGDFLNCDIPEWVHQQSGDLVDTIGETIVSRYPWAGDTRPHTENLAELATANAWKASVAVTGIGGAPQPKDAGNTLRPYTEIQLAIRTAPGVNAAEAALELETLLTTDPPSNAKVSLDIQAAESGWSTPPMDSWLNQCLTASSNRYFGRPMRRMGTGGTIPFMTMLGERFPACQFVVTGVLGPHSNAHGPNEFLDIGTGKKITCCIAEVLSALATEFSKV